MKGKCKVRLRTPGDAASELARTYRELKDGSISASDAKARAYILRELRSMIEASYSFEKLRRREEDGLDTSKIFEPLDWRNVLPQEDL